MKIISLLSLLIVAALWAALAHAEGSGLAPYTAVIDIDSRSVSIPINDLPSCVNAIANRINNLKALYKDNITAASVVGECFGPNGQLLASGRCGVKMIGQTVSLCVPAMH